MKQVVNIFILILLFLTQGILSNAQDVACLDRVELITTASCEFNIDIQDFVEGPANESLLLTFINPLNDETISESQLGDFIGQCITFIVGNVSNENECFGELCLINMVNIENFSCECETPYLPHSNNFAGVVGVAEQDPLTFNIEFDETSGTCIMDSTQLKNYKLFEFRLIMDEASMEEINFNIQSGDVSLRLYQDSFSRNDFCQGLVASGESTLSDIFPPQVYYLMVINESESSDQSFEIVVDGNLMKTNPNCTFSCIDGIEFDQIDQNFTQNGVGLLEGLGICTETFKATSTIVPAFTEGCGESIQRRTTVIRYNEALGGDVAFECTEDFLFTSFNINNRGITNNGLWEEGSNFEIYSPEPTLTLPCSVSTDPKSIADFYDIPGGDIPENITDFYENQEGIPFSTFYTLILSNDGKLHPYSLTTNERFCNIRITYVDEPIMEGCDNCSENVTLKREWAVFDECSEESFKYSQIINITDVCPPLRVDTIQTDITDCRVVYEFLAPSKENSCLDNSVPEWRVVSNDGLELVSNTVELNTIGDFSFTYIITDCCGDQQEFPFLLNVIVPSDEILICATIPLFSDVNGEIFFDENLFVGEDNLPCDDLYVLKVKLFGSDDYLLGPDGSTNLLNQSLSNLPPGKHDYYLERLVAGNVCFGSFTIDCGSFLCIDGIVADIADPVFISDLLADNSCNSDNFIITITDNNNTELAEGLGSVIFSELGDFRYTITHPVTGNSCFGAITFIDNNNTLQIRIDDLVGSSGSVLCVPVKVDNFDNIVAAQAAIEWDPEIISFKEVTNFSISGLDLNAFNLQNEEYLSFAWFDGMEAQSLNDNSTLFEICFDLIGPPTSFSFISFNNAILPAEFADDSNTIVPYEAIDGSIAITPEENIFICDRLSWRTQFTGCDEHSMDDDIEWPGDFSIADHRISPEELLFLSDLDTRDIQPLFVYNESDYEITYRDQVSSLTENTLNINRIWTATLRNSGREWTYVQDLNIDISEFNNLVTVNTWTSRAVPDVMFEEGIVTDETGMAFSMNEFSNPTKSDDKINGVNIRDFVLMQSHILGEMALENEHPLYPQVVADMSGDGFISSLDLIELSRLILGIDSPEYKGWIFSIDGQNEVFESTEFSAPRAYTAFKSGDVDDSATLGENIIEYQTDEIFFEDILINNGESYSIDFTLKRAIELFGFEIRLNLLEAAVENLEVNADSDMLQSRLDSHLENDILTILLNPIDLNDFISNNQDEELVLFTLNFTSSQNSLLNDVMSVHESLPSYLLNSDLELIQVGGVIEGEIVLDVEDPQNVFDVDLVPNPSYGYFYIEAENIESLNLKVYNNLGEKVIAYKDKKKIDISHLSNGLYYCLFQNEKGQSVVKKAILFK